MPICDNCGTGLPVGYDYCFKCGYPVRGLPRQDEAAGPAQPAPPPTSSQPFPPYVSPAPGPGFAPPPYAAGGAGYAAPAPAHAEVLANWSARFAAALVDYVLVSVVVGLVWIVGLAGQLGTTQDIFRNLGGESRPVLILEGILLGALLVYNVIAESVFHTTIGKRLLSMRVVAYGGTPAGFGPVLARNVTKVLSCAVWFVGVPVAMIMIAGDANRQRLGDRVAHTYVVRDVVTLPAGVPRR